MRKLLFFILLPAVIILPACAGQPTTETVMQTQTVTQTQTITETAIPLTVTVTSVPPPVTITVTTQPSTAETPFSPITFTGADSQKTSPFTIITAAWIIDWSYIPDPEATKSALFGFSIYPEGESVFAVASVTYPSSTSGTIHSSAGVGEYYINVSCVNVKSWSITIRPA